MKLAFSVFLLFNLVSTLIPFQTAKATDYSVKADPSSKKTTNNLPALTAEDAGASVLSKLPVDFIENRGQWDPAVKFAARKGSAVASFESNAIKFGFGEAASSFLTLTFEGASPGVKVEGEMKRKGYHNFFFGDDAKKWRQHTPAYASLLYRGLYDGIDMRVREEPGKLEYDLILAPAADLSKVSVRADEASQIEIASNGSLILRTAHAQLQQAPPVTWEQLPTGEKRPVECRFRKIDSRHYGFEAMGRDPRMQLIIDPGLEWATFLGGADHDTVEDIALARDGSGDIILIGFTESADFPSTNGIIGPLGQSPFVARINSTGTALVYSTLYSGSGVDSALGLTIDSSSAPVVVGNTSSANFPVTSGAYDTTYNGDFDAYVARFDPAGGQLVFATYLGGSRSDPSNPTQGYEEAWAVGIDPAGSIVVAGNTSSLNFPTTSGAYDTIASPYMDSQNNSFQDSFVARLNSAGSALTYSTFLGAHGVDYAQDLTVDSQGFVTVAGRTVPLTSGTGAPLGTAFPTTVGAFDRTLNGNADIYVARLKLDGAGASDLKYSTLLGGSDTEHATGIALDPNNEGSVTVTGWTFSGNFPVTPGVIQATHFAPIDTTMAFVTRLQFSAAGGGSLSWSTYFGAPGNQQADDVTVDSTGAAIIVGASGTLNPPTTERAYDRTPNQSDAFISRISSNGTQLLYSTLLGGSSFEGQLRVAYAGGSTVIVAGQTKSTDFPTTVGAFDRIYGANGAASAFNVYDVFVAKMTLEPLETGDTTAASPALVSPADGARFNAPVLVNFDWADVADPSGVEAYHIQVSPNPTFTDTTLAQLQGWHETWVSASRDQTDFPSVFTGTFYWRVRTLDSAHNLSAWSQVRTFVVGQPVPPSTPTLVSPANNASLPPNTQITFAWNAAANASSYDIQIDDSSNFSNPLTVSLSGITQTQFTHSFSATRRYWWRVRGRNSEGATSAWSSVRLFDIRNGAPAPPPPPGSVSLSALSLNPTSVIGGNSSQGTVTLTGAAPSGGAVVTLSDNSAAAAVPTSVTVSAGATSATFTVTTSAVNTSTSVTITGTYGVSRTATLTVSPQAPPATDTVAIQRAQYSSGRLRVEATSSSSNATLTVFVTSTNAQIGVLRNEGGGRYRGDFNWPSNPQNITVRSSLGGSATRAVSTN